MHSLESTQNAVMQALDHGPAYLPDGLFAGCPERVLAGMQIHANTISHARLVAIEDTFPRTREMLGHGRFNVMSRFFLQEPCVTAASLADIGEAFPRFLHDAGESSGPVDLARFEWLWLQAYHAADAVPLALDVLTALAPEALLEHRLTRHPAASAKSFLPLVHDFIGAEFSGFGDAEAILIARPWSDVLVSPASALMADVLEKAENSVTIGNLLAPIDEGADDAAAHVDAIMHALAALVAAGAIVSA